MKILRTHLKRTRLEFFYLFHCKHVVLLHYLLKMTKRFIRPARQKILWLRIIWIKEIRRGSTEWWNRRSLPPTRIFGLIFSFFFFVGKGKKYIEKKTLIFKRLQKIIYNNIQMHSIAFPHFQFDNSFPHSNRIYWDIPFNPSISQIVRAIYQK